MPRTPDIFIYETPPLVIVHAATAKARAAMPKTFAAPLFETCIAGADIPAAVTWFKSKGFSVRLAPPDTVA
jgi:hypothetical protein